MIDCIILSKDRACQLDLLIRSIRKNFKEIDKIYVLYTSSHLWYEEAYHKLILKYPYINFIKENYFKSDYKYILDKIKSEYIINFCDDNVVINNESIIPLIIEYNINSKVISASLRLNPHYNYCHPADKYFDIPEFIEHTDILRWDWTKCYQHAGWGYPHPIDNNIYNTEYFKSLIDQCKLDTPCIEAEINRKRDKNKNEMISLLKTKIITITNNRTGEWSNNRHYKNNNYSLISLNDRFLKGDIIDLQDIESYHSSKVLNSGHVEYDMKFIRRNNE